VVGIIVRFVYFRIVAPLRRALWQTILSSAGGRLDRGAMLYEGIRIVQGHPGSIRIGKRLRMLRNATINTLPPSGQILIGNNVHIGEGTMITAHSRVEIEDDVVIGPYNVIVDVDHVCKDRSRPIAQQGLDSRPIRIGRGAWISSHCVILKGVTIGRGAVLGAGTIVTRDVPDYAISVGAPARTVRIWGDDAAATTSPQTTPGDNTPPAPTRADP